MYAAHLYDAVVMYAQALSQAITESNSTEPEDIIRMAKDGNSLFKRIINARKYLSKFPVSPLKPESQKSRISR